MTEVKYELLSAIAASRGRLNSGSFELSLTSLAA